METVSFITAELGDDLIVSFAVQGRRDPAAIRSLTLLRTPKYEAFLPSEERGVSASFEGHDLGETDHIVAVAYSQAERVLTIRTQATEYVLDLRQVDSEELKEMRRVLRRMNHDHRMQYAGV